MERLNIKKLNDMEVKEQYQVKISYRFAALEELDDDDDDDDDDDVDISRAWEVSEHKCFSHRECRLSSVETS
jgi:hypothetical protein